MKRGFLKHGLDGDSRKAHPPSEGSAPLLQAGLPTDTAQPQAYNRNDIQASAHSNVSAKSDSSALPSLHLKSRPETTYPSHAQGSDARITISEGHIVQHITRFGGEDGAQVWDTACVTLEENHQLLTRHPGHLSSLTSQLAARNDAFVEVQQLPGGKGLGLLAKKDISAGEVVVRERPLLFVNSSYDETLAANMDIVLAQIMCPSRRAAYYRLYNCTSGGTASTEALDIATTNCIRVDFPKDSEHNHVSVFDLISRANHDCTPNTDFVFNHTTFCGEVISTMPIKAGSEVTFSYIDVKKPAKDRRTMLKQTWNFVCSCAACDPSSPAFTKSERGRKFLTDAYKKAETQATEGCSTPEEICSDHEIERVLSTIDAIRLFELRFGFLYLYAVAAYRHIGNTSSPTRAAALAGRALDELRKSGMQHVREEMKVQLDGIVARLRPSVTV